MAAIFLANADRLRLGALRQAICALIRDKISAQARRADFHIAVMDPALVD